MKFYKSIDISGEVQIRDSFGNLAARFDRSTYGQRAYRAFCKGFSRDDELYDKDYNRLMIGPLSEMVKEDIKPYVRDLTPREVALNAPTDIQK